VAPPPPVRSRYWGSLDPLLTMVREPILGSFRVGRVTLYCRRGQTDRQADRQTRGKADDRQTRQRICCCRRGQSDNSAV
jgi:hypothetical protein